jgi:hypothetical protein
VVGWVTNRWRMARNSSQQYQEQNQKTWPSCSVWWSSLVSTAILQTGRSPWWRGRRNWPSSSSGCGRGRSAVRPFQPPSTCTDRWRWPRAAPSGRRPQDRRRLCRRRLIRSTACAWRCRCRPGSSRRSPSRSPRRAGWVGCSPARGSPAASSEASPAVPAHIGQNPTDFDRARSLGRRDATESLTTSSG